MEEDKLQTRISTIKNMKNKINKYDFDEYANGLLKATEQMICYCESKIEDIKARKLEPNTPAKIIADGQKKAYNSIMVNLINKKNNIIKIATNKQ